MTATYWFAPERRSPGAEPRRGNQRAFTLIELLVVVGVIALLALLALPALARTRPDAKVFQCCNNLRQWARAMQVYANENADTMPRDGMSAASTYDASGPDGTPADTNAWFNLLPPYLGSAGLTYYGQLPGSDMRTKFPFPGNTNTPGFWCCPAAAMSDSDYASLAGGGVGGFFSYGMNIDLKRTYDPATGSGGVMPYPRMPKTIALQKSSATVLMLDMAFKPRDWPYFNNFYSVNPAGRWTVFPKRHCNGQGGVLAFVDGHSKYFKWSYVFNANNPPDVSVGELHNPDVIWNPQYRAAYP